MTLTKDDFIIGHVDDTDGFSPEHYKGRKPDTIIIESKITVDQILKNQEDAEKYREFCKYQLIDLQIKNGEIVERLKERIEFWASEERKEGENWDHLNTSDIVNELQKILGDKE